jgi:hypothetical protein
MSEWVRALRDFGYDSEVIGHVREGQVFRTHGYVNDSLLLKHRFFLLLDPQPKSEAGAFKGKPRCGDCGRYFMEEWQRDRCGRMHELTDEERLESARDKAHTRYEDTVQEEQAVMASPIQQEEDIT